MDDLLLENHWRNELDSLTFRNVGRKDQEICETSLFLTYIVYIGDMNHIYEESKFHYFADCKFA